MDRFPSAASFETQLTMPDPLSPVSPSMLHAPHAGSHRQPGFNEYVALPALGRRVVWLVVKTIAYFAIGIIYYKYLSAHLDWNVLQSTYFITVSITTVGFGDVVVTSQRDKLFTVGYITVGIVFVFRGVTEAIAALFDSVERAAQTYRAAHSSSRGGAHHARSSSQRSWWAAWCRSAWCGSPEWQAARAEALWLLTIATTMLVGAATVCAVEGFDFVDGLFWAFQTCTTIGYGDERIRHRGMKGFVIFYALFSSIGLTYAIAKLVNSAGDVAYLKRRRQLLTARLDHTLVRRLDRDGNGVDRAEFVVGMLRILGHVSDADAEPWFDRFDELDVSGTGRLDAADLAEVARRESMVASGFVRPESAGAPGDETTRRPWSLFSRKSTSAPPPRAVVDCDGASSPFLPARAADFPGGGAPVLAETSPAGGTPTAATTSTATTNGPQDHPPPPGTPTTPKTAGVV